MDGATLQSRLYMGYGKAAVRLGLSYAHYRPTGSTNPLATPLTPVLASFNAQDMAYGKPNGYGKPLWYVVADGRLLAVADYLVGAAGTFFIAAMQPLLPILAVECNRTVTVYRPQQQSGVGAVGYGGNTRANQTAIASGFPCSLLMGAKAETSTVKLPGDGRYVAATLLLPAIGGVQIKNDDVVIDDLANRYIVFGAERTDLGWRCLVMESET